MKSDSFKKFGLIGASLLAGVALTLVVQSNLQTSPPAVTVEAGTVIPPQSWSLDSLNSMALEDLGPIDWIKVESGGEYNSEINLFEGENTIVLWDSGPAKLIFETPSSFDEFVLVTKGVLILTDNDGNSVTYNKGDTFMLPKGFMGIWEMPEDYRELIIIDTKAYKGS